MTENQIQSQNSKVNVVYHTLEWFISAFAFTLVFIVFVMQVYRIPTGSMAETLRGAHFRIRCAQCGYRYDHDFIAQRYGMPSTASPSQKVPIFPSSPRCPSCGYFEPGIQRDEQGRVYIEKNNRKAPPYMRTVFKGDQIFVLKCLYQFIEPKRWDVIVFKNPTEPQINYIKRCVALPGETLQIIDGDIYINGQIQRKPDNVQDELWMVVYLNDYQPVHPYESSFNGHAWKQPFENAADSQWTLDAGNPTEFTMQADGDQVHSLVYNDRVGNDFRAAYAYDDPSLIPYMPICSDLMVEYYLPVQANSAAGVRIRKYGITYEGWIRSDGTLQIVRVDADGAQAPLARDTCDAQDLLKTSRFRFATVDHQLVLEFGGKKLVYDLGTGIGSAGTGYQVKPEVAVLGQGTLELTHIGLYRDIHYLSDDATDSRLHVLRATESKPMVLGAEEFFACGDNSPASLDSRLWDREGLGNNGTAYPPGVVPKDYLVGKGMFVHWPGGYRVATEPIRWIPYPNGMKPIYGGTNKTRLIHHEGHEEHEEK